MAQQRQQRNQNSSSSSSSSNRTRVDLLFFSLTLALTFKWAAAFSLRPPTPEPTTTTRRPLGFDGHLRQSPPQNPNKIGQYFSNSKATLLCARSKRSDANDPDHDDESDFWARLGNPFGGLATSSSSLSTDNNTGVLHSTTTTTTTTTTTSLPPGWTAVQTAVEPLQTWMDETSADWLLSYADLRPETSRTAVGATFLATNTLYLLAGILLTLQGDYWFGLLTEVTSVASFGYHYTQLEAQGQDKAAAVRLALMLDYVFALTSLATATVYLIGLGWTGHAEVDILVATALSLTFLVLSWLYESVTPYIVFHSLWHVFGAYAGYLIGVAHSSSGGVAISNLGA
mmetsp:Transcript_15789/g.36221  ORF Transcript_15789/g.36221 Transcript_15789/m.36221 type:complete len:342 (+) Transcript_15789:89-1114(+)|eukprot:CAMPEP_0168722346 /NCGR_PEP_ID=MMETSP0724-20121128/2552_1 /TAXON_ID=265536 /ORGANISM="Amphiprora sp., Strain CCMP467" /LENGTH=341 /DNA_ID=CAMNT_0008769019 /DNA_START=28 /DNA_END=1053 /DNA_ORIENTATION=+